MARRLRPVHGGQGAVRRARPRDGALRLDGVERLVGPRHRGARARGARPVGAGRGGGRRRGEGGPALVLLPVDRPAARTRRSTGSGSWATCPSSWRPTAPTCGPSPVSSSSTGTAGRPWCPVFPRTTSARPASSGATRSTTGAGWRGRGSRGGSGASARPCASSTRCAWTTSGDSPPSGRCPRASRRRCTADGCRRLGRELFAAVRRTLGSVPLIAEDLGVITPDVTAHARRVRLPGHGHPAVRLRRPRGGRARRAEPVPAPQPPGSFGGLYRDPRQRHDRRLVD